AMAKRKKTGGSPSHHQRRAKPARRPQELIFAPRTTIEISYRPLAQESLFPEVRSRLVPGIGGVEGSPAGHADRGIQRNNPAVTHGHLFRIERGRGYLTCTPLKT